MITFRFSGRTPTPNVYAIGQETDRNAEKLRFILPQISDSQTAQLMMLLPDGAPEAVSITDGMAEVSGAMTEQPGRIRAWVEILGEDTIAWNSELFYLDVGDLPPVSEQTERKYPTAIQDAMKAASDTENIWKHAAQAFIDGKMLFAMNYAGASVVLDGETVEIDGWAADADSYDLARECGFDGTEEEWEAYLARVASLAIVHRYVMPQMFGAALDGVSDDTAAMILAAKMANHFKVPLICHGGTIYLKTATEANCPIINTDVDFSGSTLLMDGSNAGRKILIFGDAPDTLTISGVTRAAQSSLFENYPNSVITVESGHSLGARQGNEGTYYHKQTFLTNDYGAIQPLDLFMEISSVRSCLRVDKLAEPIRARLGTILVKGAGYPAEIHIRRSNVTVCDTSVKTQNISNMAWNNGLFTAKYGFNIAFENIVGNNVANLPTGTATVTEYLFDVYNCYQVLFDRLHFSKEWGAAATHWCTDVTYRNCECNRADFHYGVYGNNLVENCKFFGYPGMVSVGYGDGTVAVKHCAFWKRAEGALYDNSCIGFRADFAIMFSGTLIAEDNAVHLYDKPDASYAWFITYHAWAPWADDGHTARQGFLSFAPTNFPTIRARHNSISSEASVSNSDKLYCLRVSNNTSTTISVGLLEFGFDRTDLQIQSSTDFSVNFDTSGALVRLENTLFGASGFAGTVEKDAGSTASVNTQNATVRDLYMSAENLGRIGTLETASTSQGSRITALETTTGTLETASASQGNMITALETASTSQGGRITALETANSQWTVNIGTVSLTFAANDTPKKATADVTFDTPFADASYTVQLTAKGGDGNYRVFVTYDNKVTDGFRIYANADNDTAFVLTEDRTIEVSYLCAARAQAS